VETVLLHKYWPPVRPPETVVLKQTYVLLSTTTSFISFLKIRYIFGSYRRSAGS
jgi:hypothetical protein